MKNADLERLFPLVDGIAGTFGDHCEVVLHDLRYPEKSIVKIANGHVTGRTVGAPTTDMTLRLIERAKSGVDNPLFLGYRTKARNGTPLKSTTVFIKDSKGRIIAALCINLDITPFLSTKNVIDQLCKTGADSDLTETNRSRESFTSSTDMLVNNLFEQAFKKIGKPLALMKKEDKLKIIRNLKENGLFNIRGSAKRVSKELGVAMPTIYKYLEEI